MEVISQDQNIVGGFGKSRHQVFHTAEGTGLAEFFAAPVFVELLGAHLNLTNRVAPLPLPKNLT